MDLQGIKEILNTDQEIAVHYHGVPVWIESVEPTASMAVVSERGNHGEKQLVAIDALDETGRYYT